MNQVKVGELRAYRVGCKNSAQIILDDNIMEELYDFNNEDLYFEYRKVNSKFAYLFTEILEAYENDRIKKTKIINYKGK